MLTPDFILLYVDSPNASAAFYAELFGCQPVESSPTFALFVMPSGLKFGVWSRHTVEPAAEGVGGGSEIGFPVADKAAVLALHEEWKHKLPILQAPTQMDFGFTFTALDPDRHRLRVFCITE